MIPITLSPLQARDAGLDPLDAKVLTIDAYAALMGLSIHTLRRWRCDTPERLPPAVVVGGRVYFPISALVLWRAPARPNRRGKWSRQAKGAAMAAIDAARTSARTSTNNHHE